MLGQSISRNGLLLGLFAVVTTLLIAGTWLGTRDRIINVVHVSQTGFFFFC